jgi:DNA-binding SARP family transcriptional activator
MSFLIRTLGPTGIETPSGTPVDLPPGKPFAMLLHLAVERTRIKREDLAHLLWPAVTRDKALQSVRQAVWLLRRTLGEDAVIGGDAIEVDPRIIDTDVRQLQSALAEGRIDVADSVWRGPFLVRFAVPAAPAWDSWVASVRLELCTGLSTALLEAAAARVLSADPGSATRLMERAVEVAPQLAAPRIKLIEMLLDRRELDRAGLALADARRDLAGTPAISELTDLERHLEEARQQYVTDREGTLFRPEFVGRTAELADVLGVWRGAKAGRTLTVLISGTTGIGKTRLADEVIAVATLDGARIAAVKAVETERNLDWGVIALLARKLLLLPGSRGITMASDATLRSLLPSLAVVTDKIPESSGAVQPAAFADALIDLLGAVAYEAPLLVVIDDAQWLDSNSRALLTRILRQARNEPILFLLTYRSEDLSADVQRSLEFLEREETSRVFRLRPLSQAEVGELLGLMVEFSEPEAASRIVSRFHATTGGNPLFLVELMQALADDGVVLFDKDRWVLRAEKMPESFRLPNSLRSAIERRLERTSEAAGLVATCLAHLPARATVDQLKRASKLDEGPFVRAVSELVDRDITHWREDRIEFTHDRVREAVLHRFQGVTLARRVRRAAQWPPVLYTALGVVLLVGAALGLRNEIVPGPSLYGGGELYVQHGGTTLVLEPPRGRGNWTQRAPRETLPGNGRLAGPFLTTTGERRWFLTKHDSQAAPYLVELLPDGTERLIVKDQAGIGLAALAPDGERIVYSRADPDTPEQDYRLVVAGDDGSNPQEISDSYDNVRAEDWSPDGRFIVVSFVAAEDSVAVLTPAGERIASIAFPSALRATWCGGSEHLALITETDGKTAASIWNVVTGDVRELPAIEPATSTLTCSPDGSALATQIVHQGRLWTVLYDITTALTTALPIETRAPLEMLRWIPSELPPVVANVQIQNPPSTMRWGERATLRAIIRRSNGSLATDSVEWESRDPRIVSVSASGMITGNRPGRTSIIATAGGWHSDSVVVEVEKDVVTEGVLIRDPFATLDTIRWMIVGAPAPRIVPIEGGNALFMNGDGDTMDGVLSRGTYDLSRGGTLELEFRLPFTRRDQQTLVFFLGNGEPRRGLSGSNIGDWVWQDRLQFSFPVEQLTKFDSTMAGLTVNGIMDKFAMPAGFDTHRFNHVALQVRADGQARLFVNHQSVGAARMHVSAVTGTQWRVGVLGASVGTTLIVRNLVLWEGPRYLSSVPR